MDAQTGLCLCCSQTLEDRFSRNEAQVIYGNLCFTDLTEDYIPTGFFKDGEVEVELDTEGIKQVCIEIQCCPYYNTHRYNMDLDI